MQNVADIKGNSNDHFVHAANKVGSSVHKQKVFRAVYFGKKKIKSVQHIANTTNLSRKQVLDAAKKLETAKLIHQTSQNGDTAYTKDDAYKAAEVWTKILKYAGKKDKIKKIPTKVNPGGSVKTKTITFRVPVNKVRIEQITIDDVSSFNKVRNKKPQRGLAKIPEAKMKKGILKILKETSNPPKDWGGEKNDIYTNKLLMDGKRFHAAFALKGPGKTVAKLMPKDMGKNGDQIERLHRSAAQVFFVQYWKDIGQEIVDLMEPLSQAKSYSQGRIIYYGIIDGDDSSRLIQAYPNAFK
jgi:hypothetical protein